MCESFEQHSSDSHHQPWDFGDDGDEVTSLALSEDCNCHQQQEQMPLHRVKRVWHHLCSLDHLHDGCFDQ